MKKNRKYIIFHIFSILICINLFINLPQVNAIVVPHVIAGNAYYDLNISYPAINATVDAYNNNTDEWIYDIDTVSNSGKWNFNIGSPSTDWKEGDQITIYIHQDNPGEYHSWNGTISTTINLEISPQIISNCYLTSPTDLKNENEDKYNDSDNIYNGENISNLNDTIPVSETEGNNTINGNLTDNVYFNKPVLIGPRKGEKDISYNYNFTPSHTNNDTYQYIVDWGDNTNYSSIISFENNTSIILTHTWDAAGIYNIKAYTKYKNKSISEFENITVLINVIYCDSIGFIIDNDNDKIYDSFRSNKTGKITEIKQKNGNYLIDENGDDKWDYSFDIVNGLGIYQKNKETESPAFEIIYILISICMVILYLNKRK
jgi:hypothetical protein